jgi:cytochrome c oxidase subunit 3
MPATLQTTKPDEPSIGGGGIGIHDLPGYGGGDGDLPPEPERTPPPEGYRVGVTLILISVTMLFAALTSAYIFNQAQRQPIVRPKILWLSTGVILFSSATIEVARRALRRRMEEKFRRWIGLTTALGFCFLGAQLLAWRQLNASGFYINRNFHSGYSYLFTGLHGIHLLGGLVALAFITLRRPDRWTAVRRRVAVDVTALYWHFIDGLWVVIFVMLFFWR